MVVTDRPETSFTAVMQARAASPSIWTVQAPHSATPQPYFVPVSPKFVAQKPEQWHRWIAVEGLFLAVDAQLDHGVPPRVVPIVDSISEGADPATLLISRA